MRQAAIQGTDLIQWLKITFSAPVALLAPAVKEGLNQQNE